MWAHALTHAEVAILSKQGAIGSLQHLDGGHSVKVIKP
jgi:hypothetical protein